MKQLKAANDNYIRESRIPIACPTLVRLCRRQDSSHALAIVDWRDIVKPGNPFDPGQIPSVTRYQVDAEDSDPERKMNKLFSRREQEYIEAAANDNKGKPTFDNHGRAHLGGLVFLKGKCMTKGVFSDESDFREVRQIEKQQPAVFMVDGERFSSPLEAETHRKMLEEKYREELGNHANILDLAITDATAQEIGESLDFKGKHAERKGIEAVDAAIAEFGRIQEKYQEAA